VPADLSAGTDERGLAMIITCENCETSFNLNEKLLKPTGSKVRCSRCKHMFTAYPPALTDSEQTVSEKAAPREIEEKFEAVESPKAEYTPGESGDLAVGAMEPEPSQASEEDAFDQAVATADTLEPAEEEASSADQQEKQASLDDFDLAFDADEVSEVNEVAAHPGEDEADSLVEAPFGEPGVDFPSETKAADEDWALGEGEDVMEDTDLPGLEESLDGEPAAEETPIEEVSLEDLDLDSDLKTDSDLTEEADDLDSEELDFSEFEETVMLDSAPEAEGGGASDSPEEDLEFDLDLEMADDAVPDAESELSSMKKEDAELEDLDFELEMATGGEAADDTDDEGSEEAIDLSDIEKMLEVDGDEAETISLENDFDKVETEVEKWKESPGEDDLMEQAGEIDLSDIMIDADDDGMEEDIEDVELELDIDDVSEPDLSAGSDRELEDIDISGFEEFDIPKEVDTAIGHFKGEDIELEFEVDGDAEDSDETATVSHVEEIGVGIASIADADAQVSTDEAPPEKEEKKKKIKPVRKSGVLRPVLVLLLVIFLPLAAVVLLDRFVGMEVPYVTEYLKQVPYLNQMMKPEIKEGGEFSVDNISSQFIDNTTHGKLFIISGTVQNEFSESRKYVKIRGALFSAGKTLAKEATVYGGNVLSDSELSNMSLTDINQRLSNRFGDNKSNFDIKPGKAIPFMVVFSDLPESLEEFTIEIAGSFPVTAQQ
jgi:predicted Zn finger-like uncharacterized protein